MKFSQIKNFCQTSTLMDKIIKFIEECRVSQNLKVETLRNDNYTLKENFKEELEQLQEKHETFKLNNSIDEYFTKYLNPDTRKNTLKEVNDLL